jgi:hypothetical protein
MIRILTNQSVLSTKNNGWTDLAGKSGCKGSERDDEWEGWRVTIHVDSSLSADILFDSWIDGTESVEVR